MDLYRSAQSYSLDKWWYNFAKGFYTLAETLIVLCSGMLPWLWGFISRVSPGIDDLGEIPHTIIFVLILTLGSTLTSLPWSAYFIFVIEQKHGFNKQTRSVFIGDTLTTVMLTVLLLPPVVAIFTFILLNTGPWVPMYLWLFILGVSLFMMAIYPVVIAPLFNKYELLPEGSLKVSIEALASSLSFPLKKLYSMDGSKRSGHANAYMYGFGSNKRIVVYDTLMKDCSEDQVVAVLAHGELRGGLGSSRGSSRGRASSGSSSRASSGGSRCMHCKHLFHYHELRRVPNGVQRSRARQSPPQFHRQAQCPARAVALPLHAAILLPQCAAQDSIVPCVTRWCPISPQPPPPPSLSAAAELGHWKLRHTPMMFAAQQVIILSQFALFTLIRNSGELYTSFGFTQERPAFLAFVLFQLLVAPLDEVRGLGGGVWAAF